MSIAEIFGVDSELVENYYGFYQKFQDDSYEYWKVAYPFLQDISQKYIEERNETH